MFLDALLEKNLLPDFLVRLGIRRLLKRRLVEEDAGDVESRQERLLRFIEKLKKSPLAVQTRSANDQHYEVPTEFFLKVLGKQLKYSSAYFRKGVKNLDQAETDMLAMTMRRAELKNGQKILELGCGWGSLSLLMARTFPRSSITSVSNSATQKAYLDDQARRRGLKNLRVITADMNHFSIRETFDRVVSVEMFEHMRNYEKLMAKVAGFLKPNGKLFVHIFTHARLFYLFKAEDPSDWMGRYFFSGGMMPSDHLLLYFADAFAIEKHWRVNGTHYQKTADAWLANMDRTKKDVLAIFQNHYEAGEGKKLFVYWRIFFMACSELWGYRGGNEWFVSHYLFKKRS